MIALPPSPLSPLRGMLVRLALLLLRLTGTRAFAIDAASAAVVLTSSTGGVKTVLPERSGRPTNIESQRQTLESVITGLWACGLAEVAKDPTGVMSMAGGVMLAAAGRPQLEAIARSMCDGFSSACEIASIFPFAA